MCQDWTEKASPYKDIIILIIAIDYRVTQSTVHVN